MNRLASPSAALSRVARSLVSWWEIPPRSSLSRGDHVRFAHALGTLGRQIRSAVDGVQREVPGAALPAALADRTTETMRLTSAGTAADIAETLLDDVLAYLEQAGVEEAGRRFVRLRMGPPDSRDLDGASALAARIFENARPFSARACLVADSFARGFADDASDLDVRLIVERVPSLSERSGIVSAFADSPFVRQYGDEAYITSDQFVANGRKIDVKYHPIAWLRRALAEPFRLGGPIDLLELLGVHLVVADPYGAMRTLKSSPAELAARAREVADTSLTAAMKLAESPTAGGDPVETAQLLLGPGLEYVARAWAGLNGRIHAFPKWMYRIAPEFAVGPADGWARLEALTTASWAADALPRRIVEWRAFVGDLDRVARIAAH